MAAALAALRERLHAAQLAGGRGGQKVRLLAVSKSCTVRTVAAAAALGQQAFGENYVQEAIAKIEALGMAGTPGHASAEPLEWHFIGPIQSNKTRLIAENFQWVQSVDRLAVAQRLSAQRPAHLPPLQVLLQVNIDAEETKSGVAPERVADLAHEVAALPRLRLRGLMAIPRPQASPLGRRAGFARLRGLFESTGARLATSMRIDPEESAIGGTDGAIFPPAWDTLSMGMSADFEEAILEGSTMVRIGTAIFGARA